MNYKKISKKQEKSVAETFDARVTVASGAFWGMKADCRSDKFLIECKTTEKVNYQLRASVWEKIEKEATRDGMRTPLLVVDLENGRHRVVVFNPKYFSQHNDLKIRYAPFTRKSFNLRYDYLLGNYDCLSFIICGEKATELYYMKLDDFLAVFKEELQIGTEESV